jgi:exodeoxyribonuclease V alpha subunit
MSLLKQLKKLADDGSIRFIDYQLARFMKNMGASELEQYTSAAVSHVLAQGHVCLSVDALIGGVFSLPVITQNKLQESVGLPLSQWKKELSNGRFIGNKEQSKQPLVLENNSIYLQRYWHYEQVIKHYLLNQSQGDQFVDIREALQRLFKRDYVWILKQYQQRSIAKDNFKSWCLNILDIVDGDNLLWNEIEQTFEQANNETDLMTLDELIPDEYCLNWQKLAAAVAVAQSFSVISGGPGTGKTTTIIKVLALLVELHQTSLADKNALVIKLAAPTGKAAARLTESIGGAKLKLSLGDEISNAIPEQASTLHRLLGVIPDSGLYRHNKDNPLHLDVLVLDEASMIDLPMMAALLDALPTHARLILLGDKDQLASVEAGSVLGDIFSFYQQGYSKEQIKWLEHASGYRLPMLDKQTKNSRVSNGICLLQKSYRFDDQSGIGQLAKIVNFGQYRKLRDLWQKKYEDIELHNEEYCDESASDSSYKILLDLAVAGYGKYLSLLKAVPIEDANIYAKKLLELFSSCQILAAVREGDFGVDGINQRVTQALQTAGLIRPRMGDWYQGRPVMIVKNDYSLGLFNGDIGLCLLEINEKDEETLRVYFQLPDGSIKSFLPSRLPSHETVYAMTIHKSQGSEFDHAIMVLPAKDNPVLTKELVYTGITRAKKRLDIFSSHDILVNAIRKPTQRNSGLAAMVAVDNQAEENKNDSVVDEKPIDNQQASQGSLF